MYHLYAICLSYSNYMQTKIKITCVLCTLYLCINTISSPILHTCYTCSSIKYLIAWIKKICKLAYCPKDKD